MHYEDKYSRLGRDSFAVSGVLVKMMLCLLPVLCPASLRAEDTVSQFWPELDVYLKLNDKSRLFFLFGATKLDNRETNSDGHLDFYAVPLLGRRLLPRHTDPARSKSFIGFRVQAQWLPIWVNPEVKAFACGGGGCVVVLGGRLVHQGEISIGPIFRF